MNRIVLLSTLIAVSGLYSQQHEKPTCIPVMFVKDIAPAIASGTPTIAIDYQKAFDALLNELNKAYAPRKICFSKTHSLSSTTAGPVVLVTALPQNINSLYQDLVDADTFESVESDKTNLNQYLNQYNNALHKAITALIKPGRNFIILNIYFKIFGPHTNLPSILETQDAYAVPTAVAQFNRAIRQRLSPTISITTIPMLTSNFRDFYIAARIMANIEKRLVIAPNVASLSELTITRIAQQILNHEKTFIDAINGLPVEVIERIITYLEQVGGIDRAELIKSLAPSMQKQLE